jgi:hypothetical protein
LKRLFIILFISLLDLGIAAADNEDLCKVAKTVSKSSTALSATPSYFISPDPNGQYVGIITSSGNQLVDLETGKMTRLPGGVDPVYTPDGDYLTLPGGKFLDAEEIRQKRKVDKPTEDVATIYNGGMKGVYQSTGVIKKGNKKIYRTIDDEYGMSYQEYERNGSDLKLKKLSKNAKTLCPNLSSDTPMISKDGKYISIYNHATLSTQIYNIEENIKNQGKPCQLVLDLGYPTGKVSFNTKNNQITFHVDSGRTQTNYFSGISQNIRKEAVVLKINIEKDASGREQWRPTAIAKLNLTKGDTDLGTGSYYPRFRADGSIVTIVQHKSGMAEYSLDVVPVENINFKIYKDYILDNNAIQKCTEKNGTEVYAAMALGILWAEICTDYRGRLRTKDAMLIPIGLDHDACKKLINEKWKGDEIENTIMSVRMKARFTNLQTREIFKKIRIANKLTKEDMLAACPSSNNLTDAETDQIGTLVTAKAKNGAEVIEAKCVGCHESTRDDRPFIDFDNPSMADINNMAQLVFNPDETKKRMPPKEENQLEPEEKAMLKKYFLDVLSGAKEWKRPF